MVKPWAKAGFLCYAVDLRHSAGEKHDGNFARVGADVHEWLPPYSKSENPLRIPTLCRRGIKRCEVVQRQGIGHMDQKSRMLRGRDPADLWACIWNGLSFVI